MAWLEIDRKAEAIMQTVERNIRALENSKADQEPPWDGFCGLVRVCDDEELKERGVIRAVVRSTTPQQAQQPPSHKHAAIVASESEPSKSKLIEKHAAAEAAVVPGLSGTCNDSTGCCSGSTAENNNSSSTPSQPNAVDLSFLSYQAAATANTTPLAAGAASQYPADKLVGCVSQHAPLQQQQHHNEVASSSNTTSDAANALPLHQPLHQHLQHLGQGHQQQPDSIASYLKTLTAADDGADAAELSPHSGGPGWVMSYLLGRGSDSDDDDTNNNNHSGKGTGNSGARGGTAVQTADCTATTTCSTAEQAMEAAFCSGIQSAVPSVAASQTPAGASAEPVATPQSGQHTDDLAGQQQDNSSSSSSMQEDRVEQLVQELLAAAEPPDGDYQHEMGDVQQQQHQLGQLQDTVDEHSASSSSPAAGDIAALAAGVLPAAEAAAADALSQHQHEAAIDSAADIITSMLQTQHADSKQAWSTDVTAATAGTVPGEGNSEALELLSAAAEAAVLDTMHAALTAPVAGCTSCTNVRFDAILHTSSVTDALQSSEVSHMLPGSTGSTRITEDSEVEELLAAATDAAVLEAKHLASSCTASAPLSTAETAAGKSFNLDGTRTASADAATLVTGVTAANIGTEIVDSSTAGGAGSADHLAGSAVADKCVSVDAETAELLAAAADAAALEAKHTTAADAATAAVSPDGSDEGVMSSDEETDILLSAITDETALAAKHAAIAQPGSPAELQAGPGGQPMDSEQSDNMSSNSSGSDTDSYNSDEENEALDLLDELPPVPSHAAVAPP